IQVRATPRIRVQLRCGNSRKREIHSMDSCQDRDCLILEKEPKASDPVHINKMRRPMRPAVAHPQRPTLGTARGPDLNL
uniref:Uncharacterized protein n=1 Tax=Cebus imitator TaxID=2715852 RepID=A0A2K5Q7K4_CEBIM